MRNDWVPWSASALVIGAMSLVFGSLLNPSDPGASTGETLRVVVEDGSRWVAMAVMYTFASVALTLGLPSILTLFERKGRRLGMVAVAVFSVGTIGTAGYAMLLVFFRAMVVVGAVKSSAFDKVSEEKGLLIFLDGWIAGFYGGLFLLAVALFVAHNVPRWVPALMLAFVVLLPFSSSLGRVGSALEIMGLAVAFTGIAMASVAGSQPRALAHQPAI